MCSPKQTTVGVCPTWNFDKIFFNDLIVVLWAVVWDPCEDAFTFLASERQSSYILLQVAVQPSVSVQ
jgi:hypothetical protein